MRDNLLERLQQKLAGRVLAGELIADEHRSNFGRIFNREPRLVVFPRSTADVVETVRFAAETGLSVSTRGAAHSESQIAVSEGGILIDLKSMSAVVDYAPETPSITVESGILWRDVVERSVRDGFVPPVLTNNLGVTVGGTLSVAGVGVASFKYGTQADNALELEVVTGRGEVVSCSRERENELFWASLAGLGQCAIITRAKLKLRRAKPRVRTHYLLYDDLERFLADARLAMDSGRFDFLESWCSPCPQGFRTGDLGRRPFARWFFPFHVSVELDESTPPRDDALLSGLSPFERLHVEDISAYQFAHRLEPLFELWKRAGAWDFAHPWMETVLPYEGAAEYVTTVLRELPPQVSAGGHVLLWVSKGTTSQVPLFMRPEASHVVGFGILPAVPHRLLSDFLPRLDAASALSIDYGGKRYLSGYINFDRTAWRRHFGPRWEELVRVKKTYDPRGILNPGFIPFEDAEALTVESSRADARLEFGSSPWGHALKRAINADAEYREAGRGWGVGFDGSLRFVVEAEAALSAPVDFLLRLKDGACDGVEVGRVDHAGFTLRAPYRVWRKILRGEMRPATALFTGKLKVEGSKSVLLQYTRAAQALLRIVGDVPTVFPDEA